MKKIITILACIAMTTSFSLAESGCSKKCSGKKAQTAECTKDKKECSKDKEASTANKTACGGSKDKDKDTEKSEDKA